MSVMEPHDMASARRIVIVTPVLDDWQSLDELVRQVGSTKGLEKCRITFLAVDDGSATCEPPTADALQGAVDEVLTLRLCANQSHQRAIALGLAHAHEHLDFDSIIVMDSDGEDRPSDLPRLITAHDEKPGAIIVAQRRKRTEGSSFRMGYVLYKAMFLALAGKAMTFGNFALIPKSRLGNVLFNSNIWNHFAATLLRSRVPIEFVDTDRGTRYFGRSRMNFTSLVAHGMSAIAVFSDIVITRLIIALILLFCVLVVTMFGVVAAKFVIDSYQIPGLFIPGYTTNVLLALLNLLVTSLMIGLMVILSLLATRTQVAALPSVLLKHMTAEVLSSRKQADLAAE